MARRVCFDKLNDALELPSAHLSVIELGDQTGWLGIIAKTQRAKEPMDFRNATPIEATTIFICHAFRRKYEQWAGFTKLLNISSSSNRGHPYTESAEDDVTD